MKLDYKGKFDIRIKNFNKNHYKNKTFLKTIFKNKLDTHFRKIGNLCFFLCKLLKGIKAVISREQEILVSSKD